MANAPDGTVIRMPDGSLKVKRGVNWIPAGDMYAGPGPKLDPTERKQLGDARSSAERAGSAMMDLDRFQTLNRRQGSGGLMGLPVLRDLHGMVNPDVAEMNAITNRLTPQEREAGSGAMSDKDVEMYRSAVPGQGNPGPANKMIANRRRAGAMRQRDYSAFMEYYARVNGTLNGAQEMWDGYKEAEPVYDAARGEVRQATPWRQYFKVESAAPAKAPAAAPRERPPLSAFER